MLSKIHLHIAYYAPNNIMTLFFKLSIKDLIIATNNSRMNFIAVQQAQFFSGSQAKNLTRIFAH